MNIIIVGGGKVGFALAAQLDKEGHDVSLIDNNANVLEKASNQLDVVCINGSGAAPDILRAAGVEDTDILIAATSNDEVNIMSCLVAKKLGSSNTIARIRNPEYVPAARLLRDELGLSMSINPERAAAREIVRSIRFSNRVKVSTFLKGRVELAEIIVRENNPLVNQTVQKISSQYKQDILVCAIVRDEQVLIPSGIDIVKEGDRISIIGTTQDVEKFLIATGVSQYREFNEIMIIGGGRITYYLTHMMLGMGIQVKIIEQNAKKCQDLASLFPTANIIHGDGTDQDFLRSENLSEMDAFIALTDNDEENVIVSMFASSEGVEHVLPKINRVSLGFLMEKVGLVNYITPKNITADRIVQYVRAMQNAVGSNVESMVTMFEDRVEVLEFHIRSNCKFIGIPLKDLVFRKGIIIGYISNKDGPVIATGDSRIQVDDTVVVISAVRKLRDINDVLA